MPAIPPLMLRCGGLPVTDYIKRFRWDGETWDPREPLPDLVKRLVATAEKVDADVRACAAAYNEKKSALQAAERKRSGNLLVAALEDIVTPHALRHVGGEWIGEADSEYLGTVLLVVPKAAEEGFLATYEQLDGKAVPVGPEGARDSEFSSPVVPRSARKLAEDKDGYALYMVTILKKFADSFRTAAREKRYIVRDFNFDPSQAGSAARAIAALEQETSAALAQLRDQSRRSFEAVVHTWLHLKSVRIFAESVLRYGLPVNYVAVLFAMHRVGGGATGQAAVGKRMQDVVSTGFSQIVGTTISDEAYRAPSASSAKAGAAEPVIPGVSDVGAGAAAFPFVFVDFDIRADTSGAAAK